MRISIIFEGETEKVFFPHLRKYLEKHLSGNMPKFNSHKCNGRIPTHDKLKRVVERLLKNSEHVIALTDVYTGKNDFKNAEEAKSKMREWVGKEPRFHPHAAQYDFEAWLLPYWSSIQRLAKHNKAAPSGKPEEVNHKKPPSYHIKDIFRNGKCNHDYNKIVDGGHILEENDLSLSINLCLEFKAFINTILTICGANLIP